MMHDQAASAGTECAPRRRFAELDLAESGAEIESGGRIAGGLERSISEARAFADAARGREQAGDGERKAAARIGVGLRRQHTAHVEQNLRARILRQASPQPAQGAAPHRRAFAGHGFKRRHGNTP